MIAALPEYYGVAPEMRGDYIIGVEKLAHVVNYIRPLHEEHWGETETLYLTGDMEPDYERMIEMEDSGHFVLIVVRHKTGHIVGNIAFHMNYSLHQKGMLIASEDAFFISKDHRNGRLAIHLLDYAERILADLGVHCITIGDKAPAGGVSIDKLVTRRGFKPVVTGYVKMMEG